MEEKVEGAAAGLYVAALFESGHPDHRGLDTARLARDARAATATRSRRSRSALGRLHLARRYVRVTSRASRRRPVYLAYIERGTGRPRPRGASSRIAVLSKPRRADAA